ncbi:hypothetical protein [Kushneria phosphatilytica]|uniref:Uncharacterized protein n=1 Tax=Kushneria phosphatilytica TaxID=657387 RepID=A0A1S1NXQ1_9GAMM|nr:hypothetical protein [Kushneria phosphatilytica]OHV13026.1 hypothetical protein BH688_03220 [Kushneria phosphatilytica]QEL10897.1 hypothetical protein FY550_06980 [Kushneria phosphatilytica]
MTTYLSNAIANSTSLEQVVEYVNEGTCEGMEGIEFSSDMLAGQYAWSAAKEGCDDEITEESIEGQLEFLREAGGVFNEQIAVEHAMKIIAADTE